MDDKAMFDRDGFLVLEKFYSHRQVDTVMKAVQQKILSAPEQVVVDELTTYRRMSFKQAQDRSLHTHVKVNDLYLDVPQVRALALNHKITPILADLLEFSPLLCNSLYFEKGSTQPKHIDSLYMTPVTPNHLIAIWVAMEDAHDDSGPLEYYPGSHKIDAMKFSNGSYHAIDSEMPKWNAYIAAEIARLGLQKRSFSAKKGDVFIWHANLLHGGGAIKDMTKTRKSFVFHYFSIDDGKYAVGDQMAEGGAYWLKRAPQAIPRLDETLIPFSEERYLDRYPDVREAIGRGAFVSGRHHYDLFGKAEGRLPT